MIRYLNPADHYPARIRKVLKTLLEKKIDFKDINFLVKIADIHKIAKKNCVIISVFGYENKEKYLLYVSKTTFKEHIDLLLLEQKNKMHHILIKDFITFMCNHTLRRERKFMFTCFKHRINIKISY